MLICPSEAGDLTARPAPTDAQVLPRLDRVPVPGLTLRGGSPEFADLELVEAWDRLETALLQSEGVSDWPPLQIGGNPTLCVGAEPESAGLAGSRLLLQFGCVDDHWQVNQEGVIWISVTTDDHSLTGATLDRRF